MLGSIGGLNNCTTPGGTARQVTECVGMHYVGPSEVGGRKTSPPPTEPSIGVSRGTTTPHKARVGTIYLCTHSRGLGDILNCSICRTSVVLEGWAISQTPNSRTIAGSNEDEHLGQIKEAFRGAVVLETCIYLW